MAGASAQEQENADRAANPLAFPVMEKTVAENKTDNMEVHHHGHVHNEKKWKEYLFQFFMLFLAVFCGMLAEYWLEHKVEHNREEQYINSFIEDIKSDTARLRYFINAGKEKEKSVDSLLMISRRSTDNQDSLKKFYIFSFRTLSTIPTFSSNDATSSQLRNSGGYRLIRKRDVADSLTAYDQLNKFVNTQAEYYSSYFNQANAVWQEMIDLTVLSDTGYFKNGKFTSRPLPAIYPDPRQMLLFNNRIFFFAGVLRNYNHVLQLMLDYATRQITFLKTKYEVKE